MNSPAASTGGVDLAQLQNAARTANTTDVRMARSCQSRAHFAFEALKRAGHRDRECTCNYKDDETQQVVGKTRRTDSSLQSDDAARSGLIANPLPCKSRWPIQHPSCPKKYMMRMLRICKILFISLILAESRRMIPSQPLIGVVQRLSCPGTKAATRGLVPRGAEPTVR